MGLKYIWNYIKELEDLAIYFPDYSKDQLPEREYMWSIVATLREDATQYLLKTARDNRSVNIQEDKNDLVEVSKTFMKELNQVSKQKCK